MYTLGSTLYAMKHSARRTGLTRAERTRRRHRSILTDLHHGASSRPTTERLKWFCARRASGQRRRVGRAVSCHRVTTLKTNRS